MRKVRVEDALGLTLCHDLTEMRSGFKGPAFRRGHVITKEDIPRMLDIGKGHVFIWEDNAGEIHEEDAAKRLAAILKVQGTHEQGPSEGKILLISDIPGMLRVNTSLLRELNSIDDITVCTLPDHYPVSPGMRVASMRIVPLVTQESRIARAEELCRGKRVLDLLPYKALTAGIIITGAEIYHGRITDMFEPVCREKLKAYPGKIAGVRICDDDPEMLKEAAREMLSLGADFLIFSGGMSVDPDDVTPSAIRELGCEIVSYGVPSQPGNMTLVAYLGDLPVLGVPGAAITMPVTVFDVLLPQIFTGLRITKDDLIRLGDGGLCQQCKTCHYPNCSFGKY